jgi:hypothetical protein
MRHLLDAGMSPESVAELAKTSKYKVKVFTSGVKPAAAALPDDSAQLHAEFAERWLATDKKNVAELRELHKIAMVAFERDYQPAYSPIHLIMRLTELLDTAKTARARAALLTDVRQVYADLAYIRYCRGEMTFQEYQSRLDRMEAK